MRAKLAHFDGFHNTLLRLCGVGENLLFRVGPIKDQSKFTVRPISGQSGAVNKVFSRVLVSLERH